MGKIFKWGVRLFFCAIILFALVGVATYFINKVDEPPKVEDAQWAIQTYSNDEARIPSRIYYAKEVEIIDKVTVITDYWSYDGKDFKRHKDSREFSEDVYGIIEITRR